MRTPWPHHRDGWPVRGRGREGYEPPAVVKDAERNLKFMASSKSKHKLHFAVFPSRAVALDDDGWCNSIAYGPL